METNEFRDGLGAQWPFLSDAGRKVQKDLDIQEYTRTIVLGLLDDAGRLEILRLHSARMPTVAVRFANLAWETDDLSPADLRALCQEAALVAMELATEDGDGAAVSHAHFEEALRRIRGSAERTVGYA